MTAVDAPNGSFAEQGENDVQVEGDVSPPAAVGKGSEVRQKRPPRLQTLDEELFEEDTKRYSPTSRGIIRDMGVEFARRFTSGEQSEEYQFPTDVNNDWAFDRETLEKLSAGKALFGFSCKVATALTDEERGLAKLVINRTAFADETAENNVQKIDLDNLTAEDKVNTWFLTRSTHVLPRIHCHDLTIDEFIDTRYHKSCQPTNTKIWDDCKEKGDLATFRITKPIIPWVFKMTVQFHCTVLSAEDRQELSPLIGDLRVDHAIFMERTKRDMTQQDMTRKCKSLILYHKLSGKDSGCLITTTSFIVNRSLPKILVPLIDRLGSMGSDEVTTIASRTRRFLTIRTSEIIEGRGGKRRPDAARYDDDWKPLPGKPVEEDEDEKEDAEGEGEGEGEGDDEDPIVRCSSATSSTSSARKRIRPPGCTDTSKYAFRTQ